MNIATKIRQMARLPRHHRIAHLRALIAEQPLRSIRRNELIALLKEEITAQLRKETRAA
jgi:hypothetical protein